MLVGEENGDLRDDDDDNDNDKHGSDSDAPVDVEFTPDYPLQRCESVGGWSRAVPTSST